MSNIKVILRTGWEGSLPRIVVAFVILYGIVGALGCHEDMYQQKKFNTFKVNPFFSDSLSERPLVTGTVVHTDQPRDELLNEGTINGVMVDEFPFPVTADVLNRGRERFAIFCSPCHGLTGDGDGMIVQRGFPRPPSYYTDSVRSLAVGFYFNVMTHGFGRMYSYAERVPIRDRWSIAAYIRALQMSRSVSVGQIPPDQQKKLENR